MDREAGRCPFRSPESNLDMPRYFTLDEARRQLPAAESSIREGIEARKTLTIAEAEHSAMMERIMLSGGMNVDQGVVSGTRERRDASSAKLKKMFETLEQLGILVKDLDIGLIDFPALYRGKEVYLCWRLGEPDIGFWHPVDDGFGGRRAIDADFVRDLSA
jgi:hypothetical protein